MFVDNILKGRNIGGLKDRPYRDRTPLDGFNLEEIILTLECGLPFIGVVDQDE